MTAIAIYRYYGFFTTFMSSPLVHVVRRGSRFSPGCGRRGKSAHEGLVVRAWLTFSPDLPFVSHAVHSKCAVSCQDTLSPPPPVNPLFFVVTGTKLIASLISVIRSFYHLIGMARWTHIMKGVREGVAIL